MSLFLKQIFTWWNGPTVGTRWMIWRRGWRVGVDFHGNQYFVDRSEGRRWVVFKGETEASRVPPVWRQWLHGVFSEPPQGTSEPEAPDWSVEPQPNLTGTPNAYRPSGSVLRLDYRVPGKADYQSWQPPK